MVRQAPSRGAVPEMLAHMRGRHHDNVVVDEESKYQTHDFLQSSSHQGDIITSPYHFLYWETDVSEE
jgi:hypothetical protein